MSEGDKIGRILLKIDLSAGMIEIDAPAAEFQQAMDEAREFLREVPIGVGATREKSRPENLNVAAPISPAAPAPDKAKPKSGKGAAGSQGRAGRIGSFDPVDLELNENQERELRAFMELKKPSEQPDQVATAIYKGEQLLGRKGFNYNEIYSLLRLSGVRDLPKALDVLLSRMIEMQWVVKEGPQLFALKFVGRDHVERELGAEG